MRRFLLLLVMVLSLAASGCDFFGSDKEGGSGNPDGGDGGGDQSVVVDRS